MQNNFAIWIITSSQYIAMKRVLGQKSEDFHSYLHSATFRLNPYEMTIFTGHKWLNKFVVLDKQ